MHLEALFFKELHTLPQMAKEVSNSDSGPHATHSTSPYTLRHLRVTQFLEVGLLQLNGNQDTFSEKASGLLRTAQLTNS